MTWEGRFIPLPPGPLPAALTTFQEEQARDWPRLGTALEALGRSRYKTVRMGNRTVVVQWNPTRVASTTAQVDPKAIQARACFLCPQHLPPEERGIPWGQDLVILCNPAPLLPAHLVLAYRAHRDQALLPVLSDLLSFTRQVAPRFSVLFNGPRCGASAPDHLHLQAITPNRLPTEVLVRSALGDCGACEGPCAPPLPGHLLVRRPGLLAWSLSEQVPGVWVFHGSQARVERALRAALQVMGPPAPGEEEPPFNLVSWADVPPTGEATLTALVFPRAAHRPSFFFAPEPERCLISPGAVDMAGFVITVREQDFERADAHLLGTLFAEVSTPLPRLLAWEASLVRSLEHE